MKKMRFKNIKKYFILLMISFISILQTSAVEFTQIISNPNASSEVQNICADIDSFEKTGDNTISVEVYFLNNTLFINGRDCYEVFIYELDTKIEPKKIRLKKAIYKDAKTYQFVKVKKIVAPELLRLTEWHTARFGSLEMMIKEILVSGDWAIRNGRK